MADLEAHIKRLADLEIYKKHMTDLTRFHDAVLNNNADLAKKLIDDGLDPNRILEACSCPNSCAGYTLLYMACVHDRMTIVSILLQADADPDRYNQKDDRLYFMDFMDSMDEGRECLGTLQTPFTYAIKQRNLELMRVLLRESKVQPGLQTVPGSPVTGLLLGYGQFHKFLEDEDVMKVLTETQLPCYYKPNYPRYLADLYTLLKGSALHHCSKLCQFLVDQFRISDVVNAVLVYGDGTDTMSYLVDMYGAKNFVEGELVKERIMEKGTRDMFELFMDCFYLLYGDNKTLWKKQMVDRWTWFGEPSSSIMHTCIRLTGSWRFICLLRWGVYSVLHDVKHTPSVLGELARNVEMKGTSVLIDIYPQCLQELHRMGSEPWINAAKFRKQEVKQEVREFYAAMDEKSKHVPSLQNLCRSVIFHTLGINPIPKAESLPLPRKLKDFVQCKELFETIDWDTKWI